MKRKIKIIVWLGLTVALVVIAMKAPKVSADEEPTRSTATVQLTAAQTLALFGQQFDALFYNAGQVDNVSFEFVKSSRTICEDVSACFSSWTIGNDTYSIVPDGAKNGFTMYCTNSDFSSLYTNYFSNQLYSNSAWLGSDGGSVIDRNKLLDYEFLLYKCDLPSYISPVSSNTYDFQFNINFPFSLSGVDAWQSIFCTQLDVFSAGNSFGGYPMAQRSNANLGSEVRLYSANNSLVPVGITSDTHATSYNNYFGYAIHPINTCDPEKIPSSLQNMQPTWNTMNALLSYFAIFSMQIMDVSFSSSIDLASVSWNIRNIRSQDAFQKQGFDPALSHDPNVPWQSPCCYVMIMCPRLRGEFTIGRPSGSGSYIDYTDSLDKLISGSDATNNKLDIIIQKLDRIYNQMVSDNGGVDLIAPETIGFTQQQKQQILQGASGLDSEFSSITPETFEEEQEVAGTFWEFWDRLTGVFPPKLLVVYTFIMISSAVSWIIYARRG